MVKLEMVDSLKKMIDDGAPGAIPLYLTVRGSHAYGTNIPTSDIDFAGVFIQPQDDIMGRKYVEQLNDTTNDIVIYELRRFLELCGTNNPNILELLNTPDDCILYKHPAFDEILKNRDIFVTKLCSGSFGGYAKTQINKAKGQDKKQNWEMDRVVRKTPIDFAYLHRRERTESLYRFLNDNGLSQNFCGLSKVPHSKDLYALYYDHYAYRIFKKTLSGRIARFLHKYLGFKLCGFSGLGFERSNELRLSSIPKDVPDNYFIGLVSYNKDGYSQHCKDFREYEIWLEKRNEQRWVDVKSHGQKIDGKNMMHCYRLVDMARDIAEGRGVLVRRSNSEYLLSIRRGEVDLQTLIDHVESEIAEITNLFKESNLPDRVDENLINSLIIKIRKDIYGVS